MIPFEFDYYRPKSLQEAAFLYQWLKNQGKSPKYFSGGTEVITLGRLNVLYTDAVIDLKEIPEYKVRFSTEDSLILGGGLSLAEIEEEGSFPLLSKTVREIADHTARTKITLGGNICGQIFYREAVLPFLLADSLIMVAGPYGDKMLPIHQVFQQHLHLDEGVFFVQVSTQQEFIRAPHMSIKRRRQWNTGYPLITVAALKTGNQIRVAISGLTPYPFRAFEMEKALNNGRLTLKEKVQEAIRHVPAPVLNDVEGSSGYRIFVLKNTLADILTGLGEE